MTPFTPYEQRKIIQFKANKGDRQYLQPQEPREQKSFGYTPRGQVNVPSQDPSLPSASDKPASSSSSGNSRSSSEK